MTYTEILELIRAGYTKEEIDAMMKAPEPEKQPESPKPTLVPSPEPTPAAPTEPKPTPVPEQKEQTETEKLLAALGMQISTLTSAIQKSNVGSVEGKTPSEETPDAIIARIINPNQ